MGETKAPHPVKLLVGMLAQQASWLDAAERHLADAFGPIDLASDLIPFDFTDYYAPEMGPGLLRKFVTHERVLSPGELASVKVATTDIEERLAAELAADVPRPVNLDPGYLDLGKLVLATTKDRSHRIYIGQRIFAEVTLHFTEGQWQTWPWSYPDYHRPEYHAFFMQVRERLKEQRRQTADPPHPPNGNSP